MSPEFQQAFTKELFKPNLFPGGGLPGATLPLSVWYTFVLSMAYQQSSLTADFQKHVLFQNTVAL